VPGDGGGPAATGTQNHGKRLGEGGAHGRGEAVANEPEMRRTPTWSRPLARRGRCCVAMGLSPRAQANKAYTCFRGLR